MRDVANAVDREGGSELRAKAILDRLYFQDCLIDEALWRDLRERLGRRHELLEAT